jgi:molybdopterin converting factor small subunit
VIEVEAASVAAAIAEIQRGYPGCGVRIARADGRPREFVRIYVNGLPGCVCDQPDLRLEPGDTISILPSVPGG